jgi:hypothetical protein
LSLFYAELASPAPMRIVANRDRAASRIPILKQAKAEYAKLQ